MENKHSVTSLAGLRCGEKGIVLSVSSENKILCSKLLSMGIVAGTRIEVLAIAPFGDPIQIRALGYKLSLRINEASTIEVRPECGAIEN